MRQTLAETAGKAIRSTSTPTSPNSCSIDRSLMDAATEFFKALAGEASSSSDKLRQRPETPPLTEAQNGADDSPPDTPISNFRKEVPINLQRINQEINHDHGETIDPHGLGRMRSFGSIEEPVDEMHLEQAREAISSVTSRSRLSDDRIHEILLAAMYYQTDQSHTLPSRPEGIIGDPLSMEADLSAAGDLDHVFMRRSSLHLPELTTITAASPSSSETACSQRDSLDQLDQLSTTSSAGASSFSDEFGKDWQETSETFLLPKHDNQQHALLKSPDTVPHSNVDAKSKNVHTQISNATLSPLQSPTRSSITSTGVFRAPEEKKESENDSANSRSALGRAHPGSPPTVALVRSLSITESDVASTDGLPSYLQSNWQEGRETVLDRLDGMSSATNARSGLSSPQPSPARSSSLVSSSYDNFFLVTEERQEQSTSIFDSLGISCLWGGTTSKDDDDQRQKPQKISWKEEADDTLALLGCAQLIHQEDLPPAMANSLVRVTDEPPLPSFADTIRDKDIDYRLPTWIDGLRRPAESAPYDGSYGLGKSRTVIVHEICRGDWTWCTAWSPKGDRLAVATQNHHLAVIETLSTAVWRVRHDRRLKGPAKNHTTHSVRSIAWGRRFIATGGTGDAVSIIASIEPYPVLHIVKSTGFAGSLNWKPDSDILAIGSRLGKVIIVKVESTENGKHTNSEVLHSINYENWVNKVAFSPGGAYLAVGIATGELFVYNFWENSNGKVELNDINKFKMDDSVLDVAWSPDGKWLYAGGEDFHVTVIDTRYWQVVHRINRERWVQCIASSNGGTHVAVGGVNSEISVLDVENGWDSVMGIDLKGLVPLSVQWHPKDQAIALTGQSESVIVVETTNARHVRGHHLRSASPILAIEFSPDGRLVLVGNEGGVVTLFSLSKSSFEIVYEMAVTFNDRLSMSWSRNGVYAVVGSKDALLILGRRSRRGNFPEHHKSLNSLSSGGYSIQKVIRSLGAINSVSIDYSSRYVAVGGDRTIIFDSTADFRPLLEWSTSKTIALAWSPDRRFLATMGVKNNLTIYDTADRRPTHWRAIFSLKCDFKGRALTWSPQNVGGLQYLAYGGETNHIYIMEIRTAEHTWETVLRIPRDEQIHCLDWSSSGLLAAGSSNGTVAIIDLAYLHGGIPVHEKDYKWQRQALTCFTEIRRNRGTNIFRTVKWIPSAPGSDSLLAVGGTDGEVEIIDLTERKNCRGYARKKKKVTTSPTSIPA